MDASDMKMIREAVASKLCVVQLDSSLRIPLTDAYGPKSRPIGSGELVMALKRAGFHYVFDTSFAANLAVVEDGAELAARLAPGKSLFPLLTAPCPCWYHAIEKQCPALLPHLTTCKPPQSIMASLIKTYFARKVGVIPADVFSVTITPCSASKDEIMRPYLKRYGFRDTDYFMTVSETAHFLKESGVKDFGVSVPFDTPLGLATGAGSSPFGRDGTALTSTLQLVADKIASAAGGSNASSAVQLLHRKGLAGVDTSNAVVAGNRVRVGSVHSLDDLRSLFGALEKLETPSTCGYHFIELVGCTGRQPHKEGDGSNDDVQKPHENFAVQDLYREFLEEPRGRLARAILHALPGPRAVTAREIDGKLGEVPQLPGKPLLPVIAVVAPPTPAHEEPAQKKPRVEFLQPTSANVSNNTRTACFHLKDTTAVLYASVAGKTKLVARKFFSALTEAKIDAVLWPMETCNPSDLEKVSKAVFFTCTQGDGDLPPQAAALWKWLSSGKVKLPSLQYAVFGMGSSFYPTFNGAAKKLDQKLASLGATRALEVGLADQEAKGSYNAAFDPWMTAVFPKMGFTKSRDAVLKYKVLLSFEAAHPAPPPARMVYAKLTQKYSLTPANYNRPVSFVEFDLSGTGLTYEVGDDLSIHPANSETEIRRFLDWYKLSPEATVSIVPLRPSDALPLPESLTVLDLFCRYLDLFVRPSQRFLEQLIQFAKDPKEKARLEHLASPKGEEDLEDYFDANPSYEDVLRDFPSAHPNLDFLVDMIPLVTPRLYSVASSQRSVGSKCQLIVSIPTEIRRSRGRIVGGLATSWLSVMPVGSQVPVTVVTGTLRPPRDYMAPILMAGLGSGLAPMRALLQERQKDKEEKGAVGTATLYQACRYCDNDFIVQDELEAYKASGVLTKHIGVFSHQDPKKFDTIDQEIVRNPQVAWDVLSQPGAHYYYCGLAAFNIPVKIEAAIVSACQAAGNLSSEDAKAFVEKMKTEGRWLVEAF